jgi:hypothetical protein
MNFAPMFSSLDMVLGQVYLDDGQVRELNRDVFCIVVVYSRLWRTSNFRI